MKLWNKLSIGAKYGTAFGVTLFLFAIAVGIVYFELDIARKSVEELDERGTIAIEIAEMASLARTKDIRIADYVREPLVSYIQEYEQRKERFNTLQDKYSERFKGSTVEEKMTAISQKDSEINTIFLEEMVGSVGNAAKINDLREQTQMLRAELVDDLTELQVLVEDAMKESTVKAKDNIQTTIYILIIAAVASLIIGTLIMWFVNRQVKKRMTRLVEAADYISSGELYHEMEEDTSKDEIGQLNHSILSMKHSLTHLLNEVSDLSAHVRKQSDELKQSTYEVQEASEQIAATMEELSSGSEQQAGDASSLSEMMEQLVLKIEESNDTGAKVATHSQEVLTKSNHGQELMNQSVKQMNDIHEVMETAVQKVQQLDHQSSEISKLILVIQNIAEQTNLLALNAAIEAARAGEHGKGFAVVADEVRKLAEQVSNSVGEITQMVETIQTESKSVSQSLETGYEKVEQGTGQIQQTGLTFEDIQKSIQTMVTGIDHITDNLVSITESTMTMNQSIESVASSSQESAAGVEQTSASIQQTSSSMEQVSLHSQELSSMSEQLNDSLKRFKLAQD